MSNFYQTTRASLDLPEAYLIEPINPSVRPNSELNRSATGGEVQAEEHAMNKDFYGNTRDVNPPILHVAAPRSPTQKFLYYAGSPGRFIAKQVRPGSVKSSIFSLVIICLGAGTITIPYVFYELGFLFGSFAILFGGAISLFAGWLLAYCSHQTNASCFEEIAMVSFGKRAQGFTSVCMILCNGGFVLSYMVLVSHIIFRNIF